MVEEGKTAVEPEEDATVRVTVRGKEFEVDTKAIQSWKAFRLVRKMDSGTEVGKVDAAFAFVELVTGVTEDEIVDACGGEDASSADIIRYVFEIIQSCYPKN